MRIILFLVMFLGLYDSSLSQAQAEKKPSPVWTDADRKFLLDNLVRTKEEILTETKDLSETQWNFKESPDRWSINQIVEHLCRWELIETHDVSVAYQMGPIPDFPRNLPDSLFAYDASKDDKKLITTEYTKPFTYGVPLGKNKGVDNATWLMTMRGESIDFVKTTPENLRQYYVRFGPNIHQQYMAIFKHTYRHLKQIRQLKAHPNYPK